MEAPEKIGLVLGRKGANITRIRRVSNCNVHADNDTQSIRIVGTPEVKKCVALIRRELSREAIRTEQKHKGGAPAAAEEDQRIADADADAQTGQHGETIEAVVPSRQQPVS